MAGNLRLLSGQYQDLLSFGTRDSVGVKCEMCITISTQLLRLDPSIFRREVACWFETFYQSKTRGLMSGKKPATRERQHPHDEQGSSDAPFAAPLRSSPLHLEISQLPGGDAAQRKSPPGGINVQHSTGRMHLSPIHPPLYPDTQHRQQPYGQGGHQPSTRNVATTVTPDSRGLLPHEMMSPPLSAPRRRSGGSVSTLSVSPSKRTRIGKFMVSSALSIHRVLSVLPRWRIFALRVRIYDCFSSCRIFVFVIYLRMTWHFLSDASFDPLVRNVVCISMRNFVASARNFWPWVLLNQEYFRRR